MVDFIKRIFGMDNRKDQSANSSKTSRQRLENEVKEGSQEAVKRYKGVLERLADYDRV